MAGPKISGQVPNSAAIVIRVGPDDYLLTAWYAQQDGRSIAGYVRHVLRQHLAEVSSS